MKVSILAGQYTAHFTSGVLGTNMSRSIFLTLCVLNLPNSLQWRHTECYDVWNHQPHDCLLYTLFRRRSKKTSKLRVNGRWAWNSQGSRWIPRTKGQWRGKCLHLMTSSCGVSLRTTPKIHTVENHVVEQPLKWRHMNVMTPHITGDLTTDSTRS